MNNGNKAKCPSSVNHTTKTVHHDHHHHHHHHWINAYELTICLLVLRLGSEAGTLLMDQKFQ